VTVKASAGFFLRCKGPLLVAISTRRRNTRLKPRSLVFGPEGFAGASEELAQ